MVERFLISPVFIFFTSVSCPRLSQPEERAQFEILKAQMFAERAAKRERRPKRARAMPEDETQSTGTQTYTPVSTDNVKDATKLKCLCAAANQKTGKGGRKSVFDKELTNTSSKALKHYRAG